MAARWGAALALGLLAAGCADEAPGGARRVAAAAPGEESGGAAEGGGRAEGGRAAQDPYAGPVESWPAEWALFVYAANDVAERDVAAAFDQDAEEWRQALGGSALFRVLVQRDYAHFQPDPGGAAARPTERYGLYRQEIVHPGAVADTESGECACGALALGETDSADPATLADFLVDGARRAPSRRAWVLVTGHGDGWRGLAFDATSGSGRRMPLAGLREALEAGVAARGAPFEVLQFDACRMAQVEAAVELAGVSRYLVASREVVPDAGHPYASLHCLAESEPEAPTRDLVRDLVTDYVQAYVEGLSTRGRAYVGTQVESVAVDLRQVGPLLGALRRLVEAARAERPAGFDCAEVVEIAAEAEAGTGADKDALTEADMDADTGAGEDAGAEVNLIALLDALSDPRWGRGVAEAAAAALNLLGPPAAGARFGGRYVEVEGAGPEPLLVMQAARIAPGHEARAPGLGVLWGAPLDLLRKERGEAPLDAYRRLRFEAETGWTGMFEACIAEARACVEGASSEACARLPAGWIAGHGR